MRVVSKSPLMPSSKVLVRHFGDASADDIRVYIFLDVLDEVVFHAQYRNEHAATLLVGGYYQGPTGKYIEIQGFTEAMYVESARHYQSMLARDFDKVKTRLRQAKRPQHILGWSMGVADTHARMDSAGVFLHNSFFNLPHQIHLAVDPKSEDICVYRRKEPGGPLVSCAFNVVTTRTALAGIRANWDEHKETSEPASVAAEEAETRDTPAPDEEEAPNAQDAADKEREFEYHNAPDFTPEPDEVPLLAAMEPEHDEEMVRDTLDVGPPDALLDEHAALLDRAKAQAAADLDAISRLVDFEEDEPEWEEDEPTIDRSRPDEGTVNRRMTRPIDMSGDEPGPLLLSDEPEPIEVGGVHTRVTHEVVPLASQATAPADDGDPFDSVRRSLSQERQSLFDVPDMAPSSGSLTAYGHPGRIDLEKSDAAELGDVVEGTSRESGRFQSISLQKAKPYSLSATALAATEERVKEEAPIPGSEVVRARRVVPDLEPELLDAAEKLVINTLASEWKFGDEFDTEALAAEIKANPDQALDAVERAVEALENVHDATRLSPGVGEFSGGIFDIDEGWFLDDDDIDSAFDSVMSTGPKWVPFSSAPTNNDSSNRIDTKAPRSHSELDLRSRFQRLRQRRDELKAETDDAFGHEDEE